MNVLLTKNCWKEDKEDGMWGRRLWLILLRIMVHILLEELLFKLHNLMANKNLAITYSLKASNTKDMNVKGMVS